MAYFSGPMRKLIRCKATQAFLMTDGGWTKNIAEASEFGDYSEIANARRAFNLTEIEIYYSFSAREPCDSDFAFPLRD